MNKIYDLMFSLIRKEICEDESDVNLSEISQEQYSELYKFSKFHDIAQIVGSALTGTNANIDDETKAKFQKKQITAMYRYVQISHEFSRVCNALREAEIPFIPLKGAIIRKYYKKPEMRTSCDIDVFVGEENLSKAITALSDSLGYIAGKKGNYDVPLRSQSGVNIELHFALTECDEKIEKYLEMVWDWTAVEKDNQYHFVMNNEMFVFYHIVHMAKHFVNGGCGIKPFIDLWIAKNEMKYDTETVKRLLKDCDLEIFGENVFLLSDIWFSNAEHTELTKEMEQYIIGAGVYGTMDNKVAMHQRKMGGKTKYALKRIFPPYTKMKQYYPILEKYPILFPFYQIIRWFRIIFSKDSKRAFSELKYNATLTDEKKERLATMCGNLKLQ